jgi:hypothetical protein
MVGLSKQVRERINNLVATAPHQRVSVHNDTGSVNNEGAAQCIGWLTSVANVIENIIADPQSSYRRLAVEKLNQANAAVYHAHIFAAHMAAALPQLMVDVDAGLIASIESRVSGETFDDLLDHAQQYLSEGRHEPAGVLAGVVFEDTIRRTCEKHGIEHRDKELDTAMSALKAAGVLTKLEQKEGIAAADLRGNATHANWVAFSAPQVEAVIAFTRRIIREKLAI